MDLRGFRERIYVKHLIFILSVNINFITIIIKLGYCYVTTNKNTVTITP